MIVEVDLAGPHRVAKLVERDRFDDLRVVAFTAAGEPRPELLAEAVSGLGRCEGDRVFIAMPAFRRLAGPDGKDPDWCGRLEAMAAFAAERGWVDERGAIRAHVEWRQRASIDPGEFRHVLGHYPTGVAVVTAHGPEGPVGMSCNSVTSVSLEPPLVAFCPAKSSSTWPQVRAAQRFLVNVVADGHGETVRRFALKQGDRFEGVPVHDRRGIPALDDALAWIECESVTEHDAGDHTIVVGQVLDLEARTDLEPLVFFRGRYGRFVGE